jgi:hypothetical protein
MRIALFAGTLLSFFALGCAAHAECEADLSAEEAKVSAAPSCRAARTIYEACLWGSTADIGRGETVRTKCEGEFMGRASAATKAAYRQKLAACAKKYAHRDGTLYRSAEATCAADAAYSFARRYGKAK